MPVALIAEATAVVQAVGHVLNCQARQVQQELPAGFASLAGRSAGEIVAGPMKTGAVQSGAILISRGTNAKREVVQADIRTPSYQPVKGRK